MKNCKCETKNTNTAHDEKISVPEDIKNTINEIARKFISIYDIAINMLIQNRLIYDGLEEKYLDFAVTSIKSDIDANTSIECAFNKFKKDNEKLFISCEDRQAKRVWDLMLQKEPDLKKYL